MRFPGFEREWKDEKIEGVFSIFNGYAFSSTDSVTTGVPWVKIADVGIQTMRRDNVSFLPEAFRKQYSKFILKKGDYVIALTRPILNGKLKIAQIDEFFDGGLLNQRVGKIITSNSPGFIYCCLQKNDLIKSIENSIAGSDPPNLSPNEINSLTMTLPGLSEQKKIVAFLSLIDERIQTQNKIIEKLETLIKGISDDLFSQKYRFSEFAEDWPSYGVSDFLEFFSTNSLSWENLEYHNSSFLNLHYGLIHQGLPTQIDLTECYLPGIKTEYLPNKYTFCKDGDVAFADASEDTNDVAKVVEFINCDNKKIVCGLHTIHARDKLNITVRGFKGYAFSSKLFRNQIRQLAQGTNVFSVSAKTFKECCIKVPSKNEQLKITNILSLIDRKIASEKKLLAQFDQQKMYLLQNLFI